MNIIHALTYSVIVIGNVILKTKFYIKLSKNMFIEGNPNKYLYFSEACNKGMKH